MGVPVVAGFISCNSSEAWEKSRLRGAIGSGFASHWLKNWLESFKPITKCSNRNHVITFNSHLKIALLLSPLLSRSQVQPSPMSSQLFGVSISSSFVSKSRFIFEAGRF